MIKYLVEFVGTFFFVLTVGCTVIGGSSGVIPPLAIGAVLMVMVYAGGYISGGHFNPAVTLGVWLRGRCDTKDVAPYMLFQIIGAGFAAVVVKYLRSNAQVTPIAMDIGPALLAEFLFTFALVFVVLHVATSKATAGNSYYGLAIGMTVMVGAFAVGDISGGAFNPAIAVGITLMGISAWSNLWVYLLANFAGGVAAAQAFKAFNPTDN